MESEPPDIVLLDVMMPGMTGFEVCRRIKADPRWTHIPVVMVTALDLPEDRVEGLESGADEFLTKPVNDLALFARVRSLVRLKRLVDEWRMRHETSVRLGAAGPDASRRAWRRRTGRPDHRGRAAASACRVGPAVRCARNGARPAGREDSRGAGTARSRSRDHRPRHEGRRRAPDRVADALARRHAPPAAPRPGAYHRAATPDQGTGARRQRLPAEAARRERTARPRPNPGPPSPLPASHAGDARGEPRDGADRRAHGPRSEEHA